MKFSKRVKIIIIPILFVFLFFCKEKGIKYDKNNLFELDISIQQDSAIIFLNDFYTKYLKTGTKITKSANDLNILKENFLSKKFLKRLKDEDWDYDPIINAQDFDENWIKTLKITPLEKDKIYKVCYSSKDFQGNHLICIKVNLIKSRESYLIDSIEEYTNDSKKKDVKTVWQGIYDYSAYDKSNMKNEYKIHIYSSDNVDILYILDKDSIEYLSKINITEDLTKIALPLFPKKLSNENIDTLYLEKGDLNYYISGDPIYFINPGNYEQIIRKISSNP